MTELRFFAPGCPVPQGSKAQGRTRDGRVYMREVAGGRLREWRKSVGVAAFAARTAAGWPILAGPLRLDVEFVIPRPKGAGARESTADDATRGADRDKLLRAIQDALSGVIYVDDRQVIGGPADKRMAEYGEEPGAAITVRRIAS